MSNISKGSEEPSNKNISNQKHFSFGVVFGFSFMFLVDCVGEFWTWWPYLNYMHIDFSNLNLVLNTSLKFRDGNSLRKFQISNRIK